MPSAHLPLFEQVRSVILRRRIRRELKRLKAEHKKLREAMRQAQAMKHAIDNWTERNR